ncbi:alpha/beta-hydrolase superfamily protein [Forsythia ovata]|uniref:Alpha/beta-hydrolase superfamily protein n=1 Tax=Forsythia ovata TaxID=205694 RepID=A0ABD1W696_9LAMI
MVQTDSNSSSVVEHKRVVIQNSHGEKLVGILHETGARELVIICHGFRSSKDRISMVNLAAAFEKEGISAFRFDFAGNGESEGSFQYGNYRREADDLRAVVKHYRGEKRCVVAIIGHSKGGNAVLIYASRYNDIQTVVNIAGRYDLKRGIEGRLGEDFREKIKQNGFIDVKNRRGKIEYRVTKESLMDRLATDTRVACQSIHPSCRVLTIHGTLDEFVPVEDAMEFDKYIPNHKLQIVEGADHEYTSHQDELASIVLEFVKTSLYKDKFIPKTSSSCSKIDKLIDSRL